MIDPIASQEPRPGLAWLRAVGLLVVCVAVFWVGLGSTGFSMSEGHRVAPAWEMIESGDFRVTRMFGEVYFRKPPGMMWAIAGSTLIFGPTEFASRAVSALACTLMVVAAWSFARRRWGSTAGLLAGIIQAGTPLFWDTARSAEIEGVHTLGVQVACLGLIDAVLPAGRRRPASFAAIFAGVVVAMLTKGPAGLPAVGAVLAALAIARPRPGGPPAPARFAPAVMALVVGVAASVGALWWIAEGVKAAGPAVTQSPGEFLWDTSKIGSILLLPVTGLAAALPGSLAVLGLPRLSDRRDPALVALVLGGLLAVVAYAAIGVSNPRYTMPAAPLWAPALAGLLVLRLGRSGRGALAVGLTRWLPIAVFLAGAVANTMSNNARAGDGGRGSGRPAGQAIAKAIAVKVGRSPLELWADGAVEARPEVLLYARLAAADAGIDLRPRWSSALVRPFAPPPGACLLLRVVEERVEGEAAVREGRPVLWRGSAGKFDLMVLGPVAPSP
jgi:4-amino-4-deoxy-L-arabinose transferase-like glycosyltransferase